MIIPGLKVADEIARDGLGSGLNKGDRVIYDRIKRDIFVAGGIAVRIVDPVRRPVWISACWLKSYRRNKDEGKQFE